MSRPATLATIAALLVAACQAVAADASFTLVNRGTTPLREVFVTPAGDANWGQNRLAGRPIPPGGSFPVARRADGNCILDIRAVFADGRAEERKGLNTCAVDAVAVGAPVAAPAGAAKAADDPSVRLVNRGAQPIVGFYVAPGGHTDWGANRLSGGPLPPATEKRIEVASTEGCRFDLRVVFADRTAKEKHGTDLCKITDLPVP